MDAVANYLTEKLTTTKNNLVETGSIKGYFAKTQFRNNSTQPAELHATACEVEDSSD